MSRIFVSNWISLDGIFSGPGGDTGWFTSDEELYQYNLAHLYTADTIIFGRTTYELMAGFWPAEQARLHYPEAYTYMNECRKHVFSKTIQASGWQHCFFHNELNSAAVNNIKATTNKDIVILGSGTVTRQLHSLGLVDEYHILLDPQLIGKGKSFFEDMRAARMKLKESRRFACGVNYLKYSVIKES